MSASATSMHDFVEHPARRIPRDLHPCGQVYVHEDICAMRAAVADPAEVLRLSKRVRARVMRELEWEAESATTARDYRHAHKLRRQAARFADG
jgi:hypothetical protein